jgi:endonuclease YncB( thermonuclease family)
MPAVAVGAQALVCRVNSIHDGDILRVTCNGKPEQVRLYCIDAPEISQRPWGQEARDHLRDNTPATVRVVPKPTGYGTRDRHGRLVAEVFAGDVEARNLNQDMVTTDHAAVYPRYCTEDHYFWMEAVARKAESGIWERAGDQQQPWAHRRQG